MMSELVTCYESVVKLVSPRILRLPLLPSQPVNNNKIRQNIIKYIIIMSLLSIQQKKFIVFNPSNFFVYFRRLQLNK